MSGDRCGASLSLEREWTVLYGVELIQWFCAQRGESFTGFCIMKSHNMSAARSWIYSPFSFTSAFSFTAMDLCRPNHVLIPGSALCARPGTEGRKARRTKKLIAHKIVKNGFIRVHGGSWCEGVRDRMPPGLPSAPSSRPAVMIPRSRSPNTTLAIDFPVGPPNRHLKRQVLRGK